MARLRRIGRKDSSITCFEAETRIQKNGITYGRTLYVPVLLQIGRSGHTSARHLISNSTMGAFELAAVTADLRTGIEKVRQSETAATVKSRYAKEHDSAFCSIWMMECVISNF